MPSALIPCFRQVSDASKQHGFSHWNPARHSSARQFRPAAYLHRLWYLGHRRRRLAVFQGTLGGQGFRRCDTLQPPTRSSVVGRSEDFALVPGTWRWRGVGVINYSPMVSGLLTGKMTAERIEKLPADDWRRKSVEFNAPRLEKNFALVRLCAIGDMHGC